MVTCPTCHQEIEFETDEGDCGFCNGSGRDVVGGSCEFCNGNGRVDVETAHCACEEDDDFDRNACPGCGGSCVVACR